MTEESWGKPVARSQVMMALQGRDSLMTIPVRGEMTETGRRKIRSWVDEDIKRNRNVYMMGRLIKPK